MINYYPSFYKDFKCVADRCPDTCCAKWEIVVDEKSAKFYNRIKTPFGDRLRASMTRDSDGDICFVNISKRCPFLNETKLCDIYTELGESALCQTCRKFQRFSTSFGGSAEWGLSLACPEACGLILKNDLVFESESDDRDPDLNELDADLFLYLKGLRELVLKRLDEKLSLGEMLRFGVEACENAANKSFEYPEFKGDTDFTFGIEIFDSFEYLTEEGRELFKGINSIKEICLTEEHKRIFSYYIYRYLLRAVYDGDVFRPFALACFAVGTIASLGLPIERAAVLFSKEIEYCENNLSLLTFELFGV